MKAHLSVEQYGEAAGKTPRGSSRASPRGSSGWHPELLGHVHLDNHCRASDEQRVQLEPGDDRLDDSVRLAIEHYGQNVRHLWPVRLRRRVLRNGEVQPRERLPVPKLHVRANPPLACGQSQDGEISYDWGNQFSDNSYYGPRNFWAGTSPTRTRRARRARGRMFTEPLSQCSISNSDCDSRSDFGQEDQGSTIAISIGPRWNFTG